MRGWIGQTHELQKADRAKYHQGAQHEDLVPKSPPFGGNSQLGKGNGLFNTWEEKTPGFSILPEIYFHPQKTNSPFTPDTEMMVGLLTDPFLFEMVPFFRVGMAVPLSAWHPPSFSGEPGWWWMEIHGSLCANWRRDGRKSDVSSYFFMYKLEVLVKRLGISGWVITPSYNPFTSNV